MKTTNPTVTLSADELKEAVKEYLQRKGFQATTIDFQTKLKYGGSQRDPETSCEVVGCVAKGQFGDAKPKPSETASNGGWI